MQEPTRPSRRSRPIGGSSSPAAKLLAPAPAIAGDGIYHVKVEALDKLGRPVSFIRYERLALPTMPLTEGVVPTSGILTGVRWIEPSPELEAAFNEREYKLALPGGGR